MGGGVERALWRSNPIGRTDHDHRVDTVVDHPRSRRIARFVDDGDARAEEASAGRRTAASEDLMVDVGPVQHRTAVAEDTDALLGRGREGRVDEEFTASLFGRRGPGRQLGRRSPCGECPELIRGREVRIGPLESGNRVGLFRGRFDRGLVVIVNGVPRLRLERGRASVVHQDRVERRRVPGRRDAAKHRDIPCTRVIGEPEPRWQRDRDRDGGVRLDARRAGPVDVARVVDQQRVVRLHLVDRPLDIGQGERAGALAMTGPASPPIAAEGVLLEERLPGECQVGTGLPEFRELRRRGTIATS
jgi:hypothetical protein